MSWIISTFAVGNPEASGLNLLKTGSAPNAKNRHTRYEYDGVNV